MKPARPIRQCGNKQILRQRRLQLGVIIAGTEAMLQQRFVKAANHRRLLNKAL